jgi:hypothetical protein
MVEQGAEGGLRASCIAEKLAGITARVGIHVNYERHSPPNFAGRGARVTLICALQGFRAQYPGTQ